MILNDLLDSLWLNSNVSLWWRHCCDTEVDAAMLEKIDLLKKSTLARTFRGDLGTNNPTEESPMELLKSIILVIEKSLSFF